jgi:hypothetical protein
MAPSLIKVALFLFFGSLTVRVTLYLIIMESVLTIPSPLFLILILSCKREIF